MKKFFLAFFLFCGFSGVSFGQRTHDFQAVLLDAETLLPVEGALVMAASQNMVSDTAGLVSFSGLPAQCTVKINHLNYRPEAIAFQLPLSTPYKIYLQPLTYTLESIEITARPHIETIQPTQAIELDLDALKETPQLFGEVDIMRILESQTGVVRTSEMDGALYVRGSSYAHNQIRLDQSTLLNSVHLLGLYSTFNGDVINSTVLDKSNFHPRDGGSLSSFLRVESRTGNLKQYQVQGGIGLLSSRLMVEGPLVEDRASFVVAARRSYFDLITGSYNRMYEKRAGFSPLPFYNFYDLNGNVYYRFSAHSELQVSGFYSQDAFRLSRENIFQTHLGWGNRNLSALWDHRFNDRLAFNFHSGLSRYAFELFGQNLRAIKANSQTRLWENQAELKFSSQGLFSAQAGVFFNQSAYRFDVKASGNNFESVYKERLLSLGARYRGGYLNSTLNFDELLKLNSGLRWSFFSHQGDHFQHLLPRLSLQYQPKGKWLFDLSWNHTVQYEHLGTLLAISLPADLRFPSSQEVPPLQARQLSAGLSFQAPNWNVHLSAYRKWLTHLIDYRNGTDLAFDSIQEQAVFGKGEAQGFESEMEMTYEGFRLQLNYTLGFTWQQFEAINRGLRYHPPYDVRHLLHLNSSVQFSDRLALAVSWFYNSGMVTTLPSGLLPVQGMGENLEKPEIIPVFAYRNNFRMPPTHRLDVALNYSWPHSRNGQSTLSLGLYNAYNQANAYFLYFDIVQQEEQTRLLPKKKALLPLIPTISYSFKWKEKTEGK